MTAPEDRDPDEPIAPGPSWLGPKASEDEIPSARPAGGLTLRAVLPNAITAAALCSGLTGIRFAINDNWQMAVFAIVLAGMLDGIDGRIARLLKAQSRFGAELDSLADSLSFGMAPALVMFLWSLEGLPRFGWFASLAFAICCALRLARFNARIDLEDQPHKSVGFLTGVPAPIGAGLAFLPMYLWIASGEEVFRNPVLVAAWLVAIALLMISNLATLSWTSIRPRRHIRLEAIALAGLVFAALLTEPWWTLAGLSAVYLALMPLAIVRYGRIKRQRGLVAAAAEPAPGD
ncbi:MAG TPA: phosphatidylcholine/phosphatidylserine synthase [Croceibacterium sp.]|nr:phosphatidylcholine/phosphatidylserine synthase [Croceibacterium sp.]